MAHNFRAFCKIVRESISEHSIWIICRQVNERLEKLREQDGRIRTADLSNTWVVGWEKAQQIHDSGEVSTELIDKPTGS